MSARLIWLLVGIVLVVIAVLWFTTPFDEIVLNQIRPPAPPSDVSSRSLTGLPEGAADLLKIGLDAANALIGVIGILMAYRSAKARKAG